MLNKICKTHLYSVKNSKPVKVINLDGLSILTDYNPVAFPKSPDDEYNYVYSVFECFNPENNLKYYLFSIKTLFRNEKCEEIFDFVNEGKFFFMWSLLATIDMAFGPHQIDILEYKESDYLKKYNEWLKNELEQG